MRNGEEETRRRAKQLRSIMVKAEVILWKHLRALREDGYIFRRQHPVGPYIADFAIHSGKLVIEVDGATHDTADEVEHDRRRDVYLHAKGWRVLRIPNVAVYKNIEQVVETIISQLPLPARR
jgi:very-short-patch-repair endonuclease